MQDRLLGRRIAGDMTPVGIELRDPRRVHRAEAGTGAGHQPLVAQADADIAGAAVGEAALEKGAPRGGNRLTSLVFGCAHALTPPLLDWPNGKSNRLRCLWDRGRLARYDRAACRRDE